MTTYHHPLSLSLSFSPYLPSSHLSSPAHHNPPALPNISPWPLSLPPPPPSLFLHPIHPCYCYRSFYLVSWSPVLVSSVIPGLVIGMGCWLTVEVSVLLEGYKMVVDVLMLMLSVVGLVYCWRRVCSDICTLLYSELVVILLYPDLIAVSHTSITVQPIS